MRTVLSYLAVGLALVDAAGLMLNFLSSLLCPAVGAGGAENTGACTLPVSSLGGDGLTTDVYGTSTLRLDRVKVKEVRAVWLSAAALPRFSRDSPTHAQGVSPISLQPVKPRPCVLSKLSRVLSRVL